MSICRYVVRAKAGKRQSAKDATGKAANSAGSSLRRYNEAALKKVLNNEFSRDLSSLMHKAYVEHYRCCQETSMSVWN